MHICTCRQTDTQTHTHTHKHTVKCFPSYSVCQNRAFLLWRAGFPRYTHLPDRQHSQIKDVHFFCFLYFPATYRTLLSAHHIFEKEPEREIIFVYFLWFIFFFHPFRRSFMRAKTKTRRCAESCWPTRSCAGEPEDTVASCRCRQCELKTNVALTLVSLLVKTRGAPLNYNRNLISFLKVGWCDGPWPISVHRVCVCLYKLCVYMPPPHVQLIRTRKSSLLKPILLSLCNTCRLLCPDSELCAEGDRFKLHLIHTHTHTHIELNIIKQA